MDIAELRARALVNLLRVMDKPIPYEWPRIKETEKHRDWRILRDCLLRIQWFCEAGLMDTLSERDKRSLRRLRRYLSKQAEEAHEAWRCSFERKP